LSFVLRLYHVRVQGGVLMMVFVQFFNDATRAVGVVSVVDVLSGVFLCSRAFVPLEESVLRCEISEKWKMEKRKKEKSYLSNHFLY